MSAKDVGRILVFAAVLAIGCQASSDLPPLPPVSPPAGIEPVLAPVLAPTHIVHAPDRSVVVWNDGEVALFYAADGGEPVRRTETPIPGQSFAGHLAADGAFWVVTQIELQGWAAVLYRTDGSESARHEIPESLFDNEAALITGLTRDEQLYLSASSGLYVLDFNPDGGFWSHRVDTTGVPGTHTPSPSGNDVLVQNESGLQVLSVGGIAHELPIPDELASVALVGLPATWSADGSQVAAEVNGRLYRWNPSIGSYSVVGLIEAEPTTGTARAFAGESNDVLYFVWNNDQLSTWHGSERNLTPLDRSIRVENGSPLMSVDLDACQLSWVQLAADPAPVVGLTLCRQPDLQLAWFTDQNADEPIQGLRISGSGGSHEILFGHPVTVRSRDGSAEGNGTVTETSSDATGLYTAAVVGPGLVHVSDGEGVVRISFLRRDGDWLLYTPEGRYIASSETVASQFSIWVAEQSVPADDAGWVEDQERVDRALTF